MATFIKTLYAGDLPEGTMKHVMVGRKHIALANIDGNIFALDDTCTHEYCSLGDEGFLGGNVVTCGCHGAQFDVTTGKVLSLPATGDLATYHTKTENGYIYVEI